MAATTASALLTIDSATNSTSEAGQTLAFEAVGRCWIFEALASVLTGNEKTCIALDTKRGNTRITQAWKHRSLTHWVRALIRDVLSKRFMW